MDALMYATCPTCGSHLELLADRDGTCSYVAIDAEALSAQIVVTAQRMRAGNARVIATNKEAVSGLEPRSRPDEETRPHALVKQRSTTPRAGSSQERHESVPTHD